MITRCLSYVTSSALCLATLFLSTGCGDARAQPQATAMSDLVGSDLITLNEESASAARLGIDQARGVALADNLSPLVVYELGKHHLVLSQDSGSTTNLQADLIGETGLTWTRELTFNGDWDLSDFSLGSHAEVNHPVLLINLKAPADVRPAATRFYIAITANDGLLVRALNPGRLIADNLISEQHPKLIIDRGNISDDDSAAQLAALVYFAQPGAKDDRSTARVIGHLEDLAGGTNLWLAEGAALVLTQ